MNDDYFLRCTHCGFSFSADPSHFLYRSSDELITCPSCVKPPIDLMHQGKRGISKAVSRACVNDVRFPPPMIDTREMTVLIIHRGYKRFVIEEEYKEGVISHVVTHTFWALSKETVISFEHTLGWVYPVKETRLDLWTNQDVILFEREKEQLRDYDIDKAANARFLRDLKPDTNKF